MRRMKKVRNRVKDYDAHLFNPLKRVYVAGAISHPDYLNVLANQSKGIEMTNILIRMGYAVFCPFIDFQLFLHIRKGEHPITLQMIQDHSLAWLVASDALLVLSGYENSKGTLREIEVAKDYGIPIYYSIDELTQGKK